MGASEEGEEIAQQLAQTNCSLLLVSEDKVKLAKLYQKLKVNHPGAEINFVECVKDGCWEADIIILAIKASDEQKVAMLMKDVATQKIVVSVSRDTTHDGTLKNILPYSKLVTVVLTPGVNQIEVTGEYSEANLEVAAIFNSAGYGVKITA